MNLKDCFDAIYCINLERRKDRWQEFVKQIPDDWPFQTILQVKAIDGDKCKHPPTWTQGNGAWGCYRSHLRLIEDALNRGLKSILLLEDDALFVDDFISKTARFLNACPDDWGMLYLGGQLLMANHHPPVKVADGVYRPWNVNRTHAFALRGDTMLAVYQHLCSTGWKAKHHIDHRLGEFHEKQTHPVYVPGKWLVHQAAGVSNVNHGVHDVNRWPDPETYDKGRVEVPFVAVLGLHSSGSSCLAGVLYFLGVHMGNKLVGYYGDKPDQGKCGYEAIRLAQIAEAAIPFPSITPRLNKQVIARDLLGFINEKRREAAMKKTVAGGKYPQLCQMLQHVVKPLGRNLKIISINRPINKCIQSISKRCPNLDPSSLAAHQHWLDKGRNHVLGEVPKEQVLLVDFEKLIADPTAVVTEIANFLGLQPTADQLRRAVEHVDSNKVHQ